VQQRILLLVLVFGACVSFDDTGDDQDNSEQAVTSVALTVHAPAANARVVPPYFAGMNLSRYGWAHDDTFPAISQYAPPLRLATMRMPGGTYSNSWHWLTGEFGCNWTGNGVQIASGTAKCNQRAPNVYGRVCSPGGGDPGENIDHYLNAIDGNHMLPLVTLNWEANQAEMVNLVDYINGKAPANPDPSWTTTSYHQNDTAPAHYFAWLRQKRTGRGPVGVRYFELGNEIFGNWECDAQSEYDGAKYGQRAATIITAIRAIDPSARVCILGSYGPTSAWNTKMLAALNAAGVVPDCYAYHHYPFQSGSPQTTQVEGDIMAEPIGTLASQVDTIQSNIDTHLGVGTSNHVDIILTEVNIATHISPWETLNIWGGIFTVRSYAEAFRAGLLNVDLWSFDQGGTSAFSAVEMNSTPYADTYFGEWMWAKLAQPGDADVVVSGSAPSTLATYAIRAQNGGTRVLLTNAAFSTTAQVQLDFKDLSGGKVTKYTYDAALGGAVQGGSSARHSSVPAQSQDTFTGQSYSISVKPLSMVVLDVSSSLFVRSLAATPNPLVTSSTISFELSEAATVSIDIENSGGAVVRHKLVNASLPAGPNQVTYLGRNDASTKLPNGNYTIVVTATDGSGNTVTTKSALQIM
jgi:hypothetical protein